MNFKDYYWADSDIQSIQIEYDKAVLTIWNDILKKDVLVQCTGFAGITSLCIWDDTIISSVDIRRVTDIDNDFLRDFFATYDVKCDYGGRTLKDGLYELKIELVNDLSFCVYCQDVNIVEV